jgi:Mg-chelatase subunit ChlD
MQIARIWPLWLALISAALLVSLWFYRRRNLFPDIDPIVATAPAAGLIDRLPVALGTVLLLMITFVMIEPSVVRVETTDQRARDFLILVDTSRSMRHDTQVKRGAFDLNFERRVGAFDTAVDDPRTIPYIARYELARESLLSFLSRRRAEDRVGLIYFNDEAHSVSALSANIEFVVEQLVSMDDYVNWGTNIAVAMESGLNLLDRYPDRKKRTVILLTDAETRYTKELEQQLARLANANLSFYLLWITTDEDELANEDVASFLSLARSVGTVVTIQDLDSDNLRNALLDISRTEAYSYQDVRRTYVDLSAPVLDAARFLLIVWLPLMATIFHPSRDKSAFRERSI